MSNKMSNKMSNRKLKALEYKKAEKEYQEKCQQEYMKPENIEKREIRNRRIELIDLLIKQKGITKPKDAEDFGFYAILEVFYEEDIYALYKVLKEKEHMAIQLENF